MPGAGAAAVGAVKVVAAVHRMAAAVTPVKSWDSGRQS